VPALLKPRAVRPGATLGIAAPGGVVDRELLLAGVARWRAVDSGSGCATTSSRATRYLAGDDARRSTELAGLVADPEVAAILVARGGYGCDRIIPAGRGRLPRRAASRWSGYSDVTALLCGSVAAPAGRLPRPDARARRRRRSRGAPDADRGAGGRGRARAAGTPHGGGEATGRLTGGSLTLAAASIGTSWEIETRGAILLLEDRFERPYRIDRMLQQLRGAAKLAPLAGVALGDFSTCVDERYPGLSAEQLVAEEIAPLGIPLVTGLAFGHVKENYPWPMGCRAKLDGDRGELRILERGVSVAP
jgi:muramoyltetrapeptide carboxypeptidase